MGITFRAHFEECVIYGERISRCVVVFVFVNDGVLVISCCMLRMEVLFDCCLIVVRGKKKG